MDTPQTIANMTLEEKVRLLCGGSMWTTVAVDRLGIESMTLTDGPHGLRLGNFVTQETYPATAFPVEAAMSASWNPGLLEQIGRTIAEECQHHDVAVLLGPGVNGKRTPLGGRNFEHYSEDPFLSGTLATGFVRGVQSGGVGTSVKHFVANEQEKNRMEVSSEVSERALREIYLLPFEMVVRDAKPWTVMCAYNKVRGEHMSRNHRFLQEILKDEWGFDGLVVSDWGAVVDKVATVAGGLDLEMPGPGSRDGEVIRAVERGHLAEQTIDEAVRRILVLLDRVRAGRRAVESIDFDSHHAVARSIAEESIVLLQNDGTLPLREGCRVVVTGEFARAPRIQGGGSSHMNPARLDVPVDEIAVFAEASYSQGSEGLEQDEELLAAAVTAAKGTDAAIVFVGTTEAIESEGFDRKDLSLPASHIELVRRVASTGVPVIVVNQSGSAVDLRPVRDIASAVVHASLFGQAGGSALARILFGRTNPSGKLTETFPEELEHNPGFLSYPGTIERVEYGEGIFVGYRHYDARKLPVQYPFGYGLSYTSFSYDDLELSATEVTVGQDGELELSVSCSVTNTGDCAGSEVVQLYVRDVESSVPRPLRELKGFAKVALVPGETKRVELVIGRRAFASFSEHLGRFAVEAGEFVIEIGSSSRDIRLSKPVTVHSEDLVRPPLTYNNELAEFLEDDRYGSYLQPVWEAIVEASGNNPFLEAVKPMPVRLILTFLPEFGVGNDEVARLKGTLEEAMARVK